jgi:hypothetical protein
MKFVRIPQIPRLHSTPLATVRVENARVIVEADDEQEKRVRFVFSPYQAVHVTTADCFSVPKGQMLEPGWVVEVIESPRLAELKAALKRMDSTANFMNKARHFLIPAQDDYIEVVAWSVKVESPS